ncbi:Transporter [Granulicella sibirica]|uniref:Transporter n=2 Tax=Granulicella sibirica TaxID=2479048 RepID=A0A4Q0T4N6_9BACT|nr:Transporter [Granulicella sibirica]
MDPALAQAARVHAREMAGRQAISHQFSDEEGLLTRVNGLGVNFDAVAENVAFAPSVLRIQTGWMESAGHRENLLNPAYNAVGIAIVVNAGEIYAVEDFGRLAIAGGASFLDSGPPRPSKTVPAERSTSPSTAPSTKSSAEAFLFQQANRERADRGLSELSWDDSLARAASAHASEMAAHQTISHQFAGEPELSARGASAGAKFALISENVAEAPDAGTIHHAWMNSPGHRENLLDARVDAVGISVVSRAGQLYAVEDFAHTTQLLSFDAQEVSVGRLLDEHGLVILPGRADARSACAIESGYEGRNQPLFIMRYTTDNLDLLPDRLTKEIGSGRYREAIVGACSGDGTSPFTAYRLAVLLYR